MHSWAVLVNANSTSNATTCNGDDDTVRIMVGEVLAMEVDEIQVLCGEV